MGITEKDILKTVLKVPQLEEQLESNIQQTTQNASNINSLVNSKADKTEINRLDTELESKASNLDLEVERKRIDLLTKIEGGETDGNAELLDIRVGNNGVEYETAGESIRNQLSQIYGEVENVSTTLYQGSLSNETGALYPARLDRISSDFINKTDVSTISVSDGFELLFMEYDINKKMLCSSGFIGNKKPILGGKFNSNCEFIRVSIRNSINPNDTISPNTPTGLQIIKIYSSMELKKQIDTLTESTKDRYFSKKKTSLEIEKILHVPTATRTGCCVVEHGYFVQLWVFAVSNDDGSDIADLHKLDLNLENNTLTLRETTKHNLGHCNSVEYCKETDTLIMGNGGSSYTLPSKMFIIENASTRTNIFRDEIIQIDISNLGSKGNVVWGDNNFLKYDVAYVLLNDSHKIVKIQLGKDNNKLSNGGFIDKSGFNGTYNVIDEYTWGDVTQDYDNVVQGATFFKNKLIWGFGHNEGEISLHLAEFFNNNMELNCVNYYNYGDDGNKITGTVLGVSKYKENLFVQTGNKLYVCKIY